MQIVKQKNRISSTTSINRRTLKRKAMKKIYFLIIALTASILAACSNDNDTPDQQSGNSGKNTSESFATFSINIPGSVSSKSGQTRATDPGTPEEVNVKTLHVFIYDAVSPHTATVATFSTADGSLLATPTGWKTANAVKTLKADKYIFAGINLTPAIVNEIYALGFGAFSYKEFQQNISDLANPTNGFVMFNATYPTITSGENLSATKEASEASPIPISVSRVIAKAAVFKGQNFIVNGGGEMQNITYGWRNINKQFYFIQKIDGGIVKDYNWDNYNANDFVRGNDTVDINPYSSTPTKFTYALENTFNYIPQVSLVDQSTFLSIRGQFRPFKIIQIKTGIGSAQTANDFEIVTNPNTYGTFYVVRTDDGISNYFISASDAGQYANLCINNATDMPSLSNPYIIDDNTYINGLCYFHVHVNSGATGSYTPYGVYRNQYYRVTLNSIQAPGNPNDNFDHNRVISPNTWVNAEISIADWEVINEDQDL